MPFPLPDALTEVRCRRHSWWWFLLLTSIIYLPGLGTLPLMDRDEPRFARATVEMMEHDSWAVPYFNSDPDMSDAQRLQSMKKGKSAMAVGFRFDKPPLTYWWMRFHYLLLGVGEFAARMHSVIAVWLVAWLVYGLARRLADARAGLLAGTAWILTLQVVVHGRLCVSDMPMVLAVTMTMRALAEIILAPTRKFGAWHWAMYVALGAGFLAKGPLAWLIPLLSLLLFRLAFWRQVVDWKSLYLVRGVLITLAMVAAWGIPALIQTQGMFWKIGIGEHVVERGAKALNGRFPVPGYYVATALASLFPWICLLPQIVRAVRRNWSGPVALMVAWFLVPYIIFTCYATQLAHYVMPGFPAAMVLIAVCGVDTSGAGWHRWWSLGVLSLFATLTLGTLFLAGRSTWPEPLRPLLQHGSWLLATLTTLGLFLVLRVYRRTQFHFAWFVIPILSLPLALNSLLSELRATHPAVQLSSLIGSVPSDAPLMAWRFTEPSLVFYFQHSCQMIGKLDSLEKSLTSSPTGVAILLRREWTLSQSLRQSGPSTDFSAMVDALARKFNHAEATTLSGFNAARSSWVELVVINRRPLRAS